MSQMEDNRRKMVKLLDELSTGEGMRHSLLDGVKITRSDRTYPRTPMLYEPSIVILASGRKEGYVGDQVFTFDANSYLVVAIPLAFELVSRVTRGEPLLGVSIRLDMSTLSELYAKMNISKRASAIDQKSAQASPMDYVINEATLRLLECLRSPLDSAILGPGIVREILYRVLCGNQSGMLCALLGVHGQLAQVNSVLQRLHSTFTEPLDVSKLAREAGMSTSALHHNFKAVTATSPLRYVKALRLHKARLLILHDGMRAAAAAESVGYESASQFSREFKRHFGKTPKHQIEVSRGRAFISLGSAMVP